MSGSRTRPRRSAPLSIRLSDAERASLEQKAGGLPLGTFIKQTVLDEAVRPRKARTAPPIRDAEALGRLLGLLGQSRLSSNLNQLAKAANMGALPVTEETEADLRRACAEVLELRRLLLLALGVTIMDSVQAPAASDAFNASARV